MQGLEKAKTERAHGLGNPQDCQRAQEDQLRDATNRGPERLLLQALCKRLNGHSAGAHAMYVSCQWKSDAGIAWGKGMLWTSHLRRLTEEVLGKFVRK